jgi:membrane protease subunit HflC
MKKFGGFSIVILFFVIVLGSSSFFVVDESKQVVITQFGKPQGKPIIEAGIHFKTPFIQHANFFEKRWLEWDGDANQITTKDKKYIWVDTYARWRIIDPLKFFETMGDETGAQSRLDDIIDGETRVAAAKYELLELVRSSNREMELTFSAGEKKTDQSEFHITNGRIEVSKQILAKIRLVTPNYGIEIVDFRIKRLNYVESVRKKVYERMISERKRIAEQYRSEGQGRNAEIIGQTQKELERIQSEAYKISEEVKGKADAEATRIYAEAFSKDPGLYKFLKNMEALNNTMSQQQTFITTTDSEFFELLKKY